MAWIATAVIGSAVVGGLVSSDAARRAGNIAADANAAAANATADQLAFAKQQYADQKPLIDKLGLQAVASNDQQQQIARQEAERSQTAWNQNQAATQASVGQMGLNALGAQNLSPEQVKELIGLQSTLSAPGALSTSDQSRLKQLMDMKSAPAQAPATSAGDSIFGPPPTPIAPAAPAGHWVDEYNDTGEGKSIPSGRKWVEDAGQPGLSSVGTRERTAPPATYTQSASGTASASTWTPELQAELDSLQARSNVDPNARTAAQARIAELQGVSERNAIGLEQAKARKVTDLAAQQGDQVKSAYDANAEEMARTGTSLADQTLADAGTIGTQLNTMGDARRADQTGFYNKQAQDMRDIARQRAADLDLRASTRANADIATASDSAQRQLARLGGDPNRMAAMAGDIANSEQLARIGSGNQVAGINVANLNASDDAARGLEQAGFTAGTQQQYGLQDQAVGVKSGALDAARNIRATTAQGVADRRLSGASAAQGVQFAGQNQGAAIENAATDKVRANTNAMQQGTANYGAGFANTSGQSAQLATSASNAGLNGLNTAIQSPVGLMNTMNGAVGNSVNAAGVGVKASDAVLNAGQKQASALSGMIGTVGGYLNNPTGYDPSEWIKSSKKAKRNRRPVDPDQALEGLEDAAPQTYDYKPGMGPPGRKIGPMAEDMNEEFGESVAPGGKVISVQNTLGLQHAAIVGLKKRLDKLESRKGARHAD